MCLMGRTSPRREWGISAHEAHDTHEAAYLVLWSQGVAVGSRCVSLEAFQRAWVSTREVVVCSAG